MSFSPRFAATVLAWVGAGWLAVILLIDGRHVVGLVLLAVALAAMARPGIDLLDRWLPRAAALATVFIVGTAAVVGLLVVQSRDLSAQADRLAAAVPARIEELEAGRLRDVLVEADVAGRVTEMLGALPTQVLAGTGDRLAAGRQAFELVLVVFLAVYALQGRQRLVDGLASVIPARHRRRVVGTLGRSALQAGRYLDRTIALAVVAGAVGAAVAWALDLPGMVVLGVWVGAWSIVPLAGAVVGYAPIALLASGSGTGPLAVAVAAAMVWAAAEWAVGRWVFRSVSRPGPLLATIALMAGIQLGWLVGVVVALFVTALLVAFAEDWGAAADADVVAPPAEASGAPPGVGAPEGRRGIHFDRLDPRSAAMAVALVTVAAAVLDAAGHAAPVVTRVALGLTLAVALHQVVDLLTGHTPLSRRSAAWVVIGGVLAALVGFFVLALPSVIRNTVDLTADAPRIVDDLGRLPLVGGRLETSGALGRLHDAIDSVPDRLATDADPLQRALFTVGGALNATFWVLLVTATALNDGPRLVRLGLRLTPARRRARIEAALRLVYRSVGRYGAGSALIATIAGSFVFAVALVLGVPLAALCGVWTALWNFVPKIGGYVGGVPLIVFAFAEGGTTGLVALVAYLVYWQVENRLIQPIVISRTVDLPAFVAMVVVLLGAAVAGVAGAVLATPAVGAAKLIVTRWRSLPDGSGTRGQPAAS